ncbi:ATP-binding cassette domain-containing protein [Alphaproteobacteria bacterium GH1-50]|uniref:ATP-binding cassette domain-containing protein n=1 Tax=Kangsaoukella pontilimi TaxID=2691042 RepID=A0A7C9IF99_9RHOB|nr:ABC transporter ATP-binding protein [Kangsaoukella pontilimi]MXQ07388.1 ATP-binding cassette domain-containing protein [Kangsaoukella pontilimi]
MLELRTLSKCFGGVQAVRDVSFAIEPGEIRGLIGPNGAGKSTLVNLISGLLRPTGGEIVLDGRSMTGLRADQCARNGIARTFQNLRLFSSLTVEQNIDVARQAGHDPALIDAALVEFGLTRHLARPAGALAYGDQRRLEIVRALALAPKLLMLDEPAAGMNEEETAALGQSLEWVRDAADCALLVIDHDLKFIMTLCHRIAVMDMGAVIASGDPAEIARNPEVIRAYLGDAGGDDAPQPTELVH